MAGHYFYDPRPYYGLNMSTNLMPLDELFYKYEPVPYWMDQRMAPMSFPDYHSGHKQLVSRGPEVQQFLPYNRPEQLVRDDIYTDMYKRSPQFNGFGAYPEMRQLRGQTQDDTWLHTMTPQYVNPQSQFAGRGLELQQGLLPQQGTIPQRGYGAMADMPMPMGHMTYNGGQQYLRQVEVPMSGHMNHQNFSNYNGGEQYGQMDVTNKGNKSHGSNNHGSNNKNYNNDDGYSNKSGKQMYNNDDNYGNKTSKQMYNNDDSYGNKSNKQMYTNDDNYGNKSSKQMYNNDDSYGNKSNKQMYTNDDNYGNKSSKQMYNNDDSYGNKSNKQMYSNDDNYGNKSSKQMYSNDDGYGNKSNKQMNIPSSQQYSNGGNGNTNYGMTTKQGNKKQQQRYTNDDSSSDDDEDEYGNSKNGGKWGTKPLLKHGKADTYSHGKKFDSEGSSKKSGKSSDYQSYGGNNMVVFDSGKKQSGHKHGSQSKSSKMLYQNGGDSSSDEDDNYAYTRKASKGQQSQGITKVQPSHGHGGKEQSRGYDAQLRNYGQQAKHTQFHSQSKSVELKVPICCDNCERKVRACLEYIDGVESVLCDQWQKKVIVYGNVKPEAVLKRVKRVKKASELWQQAKRVPVY